MYVNRHKNSDFGVCIFFFFWCFNGLRCCTLFLFLFLTYAVKFFLEIAFVFNSNTLYIYIYACLFWPLWRDAFSLICKRTVFLFAAIVFFAE